MKNQTIIKKKKENSNEKKILLSTISAIFLITMAGCKNDNSNNGYITNTGTDVEAERGPILEAIVKDKEGQTAIEIANGKYHFNNSPKYPIKVLGGYIDVDRNGIVSEGDIKNNLILQSSDAGTAITIVTTMLNSKELSETLKKYNIDFNDLKNQTPSRNKKIAAISDEVFKYALKNNISDISEMTKNNFENLENKIKDKIIEYSAPSVLISEIEKKLIKELNDENKIKILTKAEAEKIEEEKTSKISTGFDDINYKYTIKNIKKGKLNQEIISDIIKLKDKQQLSKDIYSTLSDVYADKQLLKDLKTKAENKQQEMMEILIEKYDINTTVNNGVNEYSDKKYSDIYSDMTNKGSISYIDTLKVGCEIEKQDLKDIKQAKEKLTEENKDLEIVYDNLEESSNKHIKIFEKLLNEKKEKCE